MSLINQHILLKIFFAFIILVSVLVSTSCKEDKLNDSNKSIESLLKLVEEDPITFPLDIETDHNVYIKLNTINNIPFLNFYNGNNNCIYIYNINTKSLTKRVELEKEGTNGIELGGLLAPDYFIHTLDSIFLTGYINQYLINGDGEILVKGSVNANKSGIISLEDKDLSFDKATYFKNGNIYSGITSYISGNEATHLRAVIPLSFDSVSDTFIRKDVLIENYEEVSKIKAELLNEGKMAVMGLSFARNGDYLYASTPISDIVYIFKNKELIDKVNTSTHEIRMPDTRGYFDQFRDKSYLKTISYPFYKGLFTDVNDNRNILYRIVSKGNFLVYNENTKQDEQKSKGGYLIVINLNTNKTTYIDLPTEYIDLNSCFIFDGKIYFKLKVQINENEMTFKVFRIR